MIDELIERVEKGEGADRELDCLLVAILDGRTIREDGSMILARNSRPPHDEYIVGWIDLGETRRNFSEGHSVPPVRRYTASLDAVLTLIEEKLPGWTWYVQTYEGVPTEAAMWPPKTPGGLTIEKHSGFTTSPARALLAAFLRAHKEQHDGR
ncbi:hypothetical protein DK26_15270 [Bosea sp. WAO]|uniref:hypothetical protein n=1 Tax=Bosea sp. WAO TaxID=406341 RepID=UPI00074AC076|nr:hypothetical protein [Bosea sp. WAO]KUL94365.1 hypothetical protein DK26_15270 [Bosea sp. WAO]